MTPLCLWRRCVAATLSTAHGEEGASSSSAEGGDGEDDWSDWEQHDSDEAEEVGQGKGVGWERVRQEPMERVNVDWRG